MTHHLSEFIRRRKPGVLDYVQIAVGCTLMAASFRLFFNSNHIVSGGIVGVSTVLQGAVGVEPAVVQWAINLPLLVLGFVLLGKREGIQSLFGSLLLPAEILLFKNLHAITSNTLLAALFGGALYGAGLGLILLARGSVGGYSLIARTLAKYAKFSVSTVIFVLDAVTILAGGFMFGADSAMVGLISTVVVRWAIDWVVLGFSKALVAYVISEDYDRIKQGVLVDMDRGITVLSATGGYTNASRPVLMLVLGRLEVPRLRALVQEIDPNAFIVIHEATEVLGRGFGGQM
jgi:uncharacterized membrane-anchored protein YitT (DUF2179 family)